MTALFNKNVFCRCCHSDSAEIETNVEIRYYDMVKDTFGIQMKQVSPETGNSICTECTQKLHDAVQFKLQVLLCEQKLEKYYKNDHSYNSVTNYEIIKKETESLHDEDDCMNDDEFHDDIINNEEIFIAELEVKPKTKRKETKYKPKGESQPPKRIRNKYGRSIEIHVETENGVIYSCRVCGEKYDSQKSLKHHIKFYKHLNQYRCKLCDREYIKKKSLETHLKVHCNGKPYGSVYCGKKCWSEKTQRAHEKLHDKLVKYICDLCNKEFSCKQTIGRHLKLHSGTLIKKLCDICGWLFNDNTQLSKHIQTVHEKLRPFFCSKCPKKFSAKRHLKCHIMRKHCEGDAISLHKCNMCSKYFSSLYSLKNHLKLHNGREYVCKTCDVIFKDKKIYLSHLRSHRIKPLFCDLCGKKFTRQFTLSRHVKEHVNKKKYSCDICGKKFLQKCGILRHKRRQHNPTVNDREKFKCKICKLNVVDLEKHVEVHYNRPHCCDFCGKTFSQKNYLNRHIKTAHCGSRPHACSICGASYIQKRALRTHALKSHKMTLKTEKDNLNNDIPTKSLCKIENDIKV